MTPGRGLSAVAASLAAAALLTACSDSSDPADSSRSPGTSGLPDVGAEPDVPMLAVATDDLAITSDGTQLIADCRPGPGGLTARAAEARLRRRLSGAPDDA